MVELDYLAPDLTGQRFHETINALRAETWLASSPLGYFVLDRDAATFFLRTKSATFPGLRIAEMFGVEEGPLLEQMRRNILHINGDGHRRLRNLVNPAFTPARHRALAPRDARVPGAALGAARGQRVAASSWPTSRSRTRRSRSPR